MTKLSPPPPIRIPSKLMTDPELQAFFKNLVDTVYNLWFAGGGQQGGVIFDDRVGEGAITQYIESISAHLPDNTPAILNSLQEIEELRVGYSDKSAMIFSELEALKNQIGALNGLVESVKEERVEPLFPDTAVQSLLNDLHVELGTLAARINLNMANLLAYQPLSPVLTGLAAACTYPLVSYGGYSFSTGIYLDGNALTGIADSKLFHLVADMRFANNATATERWMDATGSGFFVSRNSAGNFQIQAENAAGTSILNIVTNTAVAALAGRYLIEISCDMAVGITVKVNGVVQTYTTTTFTNDTIDFTLTEFSVGAGVSGGQQFTGDFYTLYFNVGVAPDITLDSVSRKFYAPDLTPVFMGWQGELPTGSQPILFLAYDGHTNWFRNRGSAVSTNFTEHGTPAAVTTALNGQYSAGRNGNHTRTVTAAGAVYVGIADDTVGINKTVGAATTVNLPKATGTGKRYTITDVKGDANANNITLTPPSGTINGAATLVMNVNYQSETIEDMATDVYMRV